MADNTLRVVRNPYDATDEEWKEWLAQVHAVDSDAVRTVAALSASGHVTRRIVTDDDETSELE